MPQTSLSGNFNPSLKTSQGDFTGSGLQADQATTFADVVSNTELQWSPEAFLAQIRDDNAMDVDDDTSSVNVIADLKRIIRDEVWLENEKAAEYSRITARRKEALNQLPLANRDEASRAIDQLPLDWSQREESRLLAEAPLPTITSGCRENVVTSTTRPTSHDEPPCFGEAWL